MEVTVVNGVLEPHELEAYVTLAKEKYGDNLSELRVEILNDDEVTLTYVVEKASVPFERIRRITGYLVGTTDRWNSAKKAEERDRVKHNVSEGGGD